MGTGKREAARRERQGKTSDGMGNVRTKGENFYRSVRIPTTALCLRQYTNIFALDRPSV